MPQQSERDEVTLLVLTGSGKQVKSVRFSRARLAWFAAAWLVAMLATASLGYFFFEARGWADQGSPPADTRSVAGASRQ